MPRPHAFRPSLSDRLEERVVLSRATAALVHVDGAPARSGALKFGAMGDSITDEYRFDAYGRSGAKNWVEILAATRNTKFGPFSRASLGEPRLAGYAANWARDGATSDDMVRQQLPGLANQVRRGQVNAAWIFIGANDYFNYAKGVSPLSPPTASEAASALAKIETRLDDNLTTAVRTLMAANPSTRLVIGTLPDLRQLPAVATLAQIPAISPLFEAAAASISQFNARVRALAAEDPTHIAVADLDAMFKSAAQAAGATGKLNVGGQAIDVRTPGDAPTHLFLSDGVHLGTVGQGLIANLFLQTVDNAFNVKIRLLKPAEILRQAKIR